MVFINKLIKLLSLLAKRKYYPFISCISEESYYLIKKYQNMDFNQIPDDRNNIEYWITNRFEGWYAHLFASARMAFYSILKSLNLPPNSEVILTGFTCSVMVNAVLRLGLKPIFADIDTDTLGSDALSIKRKITVNTKVVVAQHSFGIPCKIDKIKEICKYNDLFLIEDCAISFMSSYKSKMVGLWGDAAIFSLDHTKPVNTLIGGFVICKDADLSNKINRIKKESPDLAVDHQYSLLKRLAQEYKYCRPNRYAYYKIAMLIFEHLNKKNDKKKGVFLNNEFTYHVKKSYYEYPSKYPKILSSICLIELERYLSEIEILKNFMNKYIKDLNQRFIILPKGYFNSNNDIVPLRIAFQIKGEKEAQYFYKRFDGDYFWFKKPIVASSDPLESFGYYLGDCPNAEMIGKNIINVPCKQLIQ
jgi:dTDP-4-amino-4,6-dideoxygalactose transaminase